MGEKNLNKDFSNTRRGGGHHFEKVFLKILAFLFDGFPEDMRHFQLLDWLLSDDPYCFGDADDGKHENMKKKKKQQGARSFCIARTSQCYSWCRYCLCLLLVISMKIWGWHDMVTYQEPKRFPSKSLQDQNHQKAKIKDHHKFLEKLIFKCLRYRHGRHWCCREANCEESEENLKDFVLSWFC